jgi:Tfp pilus assembly protein PilF
VRPGGRASLLLPPALALLAACTPPEEAAAPADGLFVPRPADPPPLGTPRPREGTPVEMGFRHLAAGEPEQARLAFGEALLVEGPTVEALIGLGTASERLGRLAEARRVLERAVELDPDNPTAWNNLGIVRQRIGDWPGAREALRNAFALDGGRSDAIRLNLAMVEAQSPTPFDPDGAPVQFDLVETDGGRYLLIDRQPPPVTE